MALTIEQVISNPLQLENERQYLLSQVAAGSKSGDKGLVNWALEQAKSYGLSDLSKSVLPVIPSVKDDASKSPSEVILSGTIPAISANAAKLANGLINYPSNWIKPRANDGTLDSLKASATNTVSAAKESVLNLVDIQFGDGIKTALLVVVALAVGSALLGILRR